RPVPAEVEGVVLAVDAEALGSAAMILGAGRARAEDRIDPAAGLVIERKVGEAVRRGDSLATVHGARPAAVEEGIRRVRAAYTIGVGTPARAPLIYEIVA
ncbi:MAG TPA: thymidine phosphorylase, partial [bacterium]|nr:thymidine phosphorylase [bacterium]